MRLTLPALLLLSACAATTAPAPVWQSTRSFEPLSTTAISITGPVAFAPGTLAFAGKTPVPVQSLGLKTGPWKDDGGEATAEIFRLAADPGTLLNGNTLCGSPATYAVFYQDDTFGPTLSALVFDGKDAPAGADSPGLCATFNYAID